MCGVNFPEIYGIFKVLKFALRFVLIELRTIFFLEHVRISVTLRWSIESQKMERQFFHFDHQGGASIFTTKHQLSFSLLTAQLLKDKLKL